MRFKKHELSGARPDMTPMIDIVFQLIAFFMVVINFSAVNADERIKLPVTQLARPPLAPAEDTLVLNLDARGVLYYAGSEITLEEFTPYLKRERQRSEYTRRVIGAEKLPTTVIIRAGRETPTGRVQQLIQMCQRQGFEKFSLKARERD